jgi:hypothetical protein
MQGSRITERYFIDLKLPLHEKKKTATILTGNRNITWVIGKQNKSTLCSKLKMEKVLKISVSGV